MTLASLLYPCLSVFALAAPAPVSAAVPAVAVTTVQQDQDSDPVRIEPVEPQEAGAADDSPTELQVTSERPAPGEADRPVAFAELADEQVLERALAWLQGVKTMRADFIQTAPNGNVTGGVMQLSRPGRLRFDYDDPSPLLIVATQGLVYVHDSDLEDTDSYPVSRTPLKFLLTDEIGSDEATLLDVRRFPDSVSLTLEPTDPETQGQLVMEFAAPDLSLLRIAVYDPRGGITVTDFDNLETGVRLANSAFRVPEAGGSFLRER